MFCIFIFIVGPYTTTIVSWILTGSNPLNIQIYFTFNPFPNYTCHILSYLLYWPLCKSTDIPAGHTLRKLVSSRWDITFTNKTFPITKHIQNQSSQLTWGNIFSTSIPNLSTIRTLAITTQNTIIFCSDLEMMLKSWFSTTWIFIISNKFVDVYIFICKSLIADSSASCHRSESILKCLGDL